MAQKAAVSAANSNKATKTKKSQTLYQKVDNIIRQRLIDNVWKPGDALPSEMQLADELDVSQGTVRKALNDMVTENLLFRRQGLGTFVSEHTERRALFLYFSIVGNDGSRLLPESNILSCEEKIPTPEEAEKLQLNQGDMIVQFRRIRFFNNVPIIVETISLPLEHFPGFGTDVEPPNNLFRFYQSAYGVTVAKAEEHLKAVRASAEETDLLGIADGAPLLEIDRIAKMLDSRPVEWRVSHCDTSNYRYVAERG
ncbi:MAG: GntR family transcriptional regulator [Rhodospirillales bacterium]|jgi:GntR family transcriptional regulator|nr:GntR family transcriptional regulator [Rhodospirillales bacterium]MDP7424367.1 GntR family transcriptional regulator [Rhodospirillales bacterium]